MADATPRFANLVDLAGLTEFKAKCDILYAKDAEVIKTVKVNNAALTASDNAVDITVVTGDNNGEIKVNGSAVAVKGLGTAAYQNVAYFDLAGAADDAKTEILGSDSDVYGTNHTISALENAIDSISGSGSGSIADQIESALDQLDYTLSSGSGNVLTGFQVANGKLVSGSMTTRGVATAITENSTDLATSGEVYDAIEAAKTASKNAIDFAIAAETNKVISGFEVEDGEIKSGTVTKVTLGSAALVDTETAVANDGNVPTGAAVQTYVNSLDFQTSDDVQTAINTALTSALIYKGVKATKAELPTTDNKVGDMWHVTADGGEYAWNGEAWEEMGSVLDLSPYAKEADFTVVSNAQIDALFA